MFTYKPECCRLLVAEIMEQLCKKVQIRRTFADIFGGLILTNISPSKYSTPFVSNQVVTKACP